MSDLAVLIDSLAWWQILALGVVLAILTHMNHYNNTRGPLTKIPKLGEGKGGNIPHCRPCGYAQNNL